MLLSFCPVVAVAVPAFAVGVPVEVPYRVKEINTQIAGWPTGMGDVLGKIGDRVLFYGSNGKPIPKTMHAPRLIP